MLLRIILLLTVSLSLSFPAVVPAAVLDHVREDFRPVSGYVIRPVNGSYLIDLDADSGVRIGDLLTVIREGEKIIHPVTKEVLGTLDDFGGILQVTRIDSGFFYARPIGKDRPEIVEGAEVRRYANLKVTFWDYTGQGEAFYADLKSAIPQLEWPGYQAAQDQRPSESQLAPADRTQLYVLLRHDGLQMRGPDFDVLRSYPLPEGLQPTTKDRKDALISTGHPSPSLPPSATRVEPSVSRDRKENFPAFPEFRTLGSLPQATVMADFVETEGQLLIAATDGSSIRVFSLGETLRETASGDTVRPGEILSLHWWRPEARGALYLVATQMVQLNQPGANYVGHKPVGAIFRLEGNRLVAVREGLDSMLGSFDRDGDGRKETLLGQEFDRDITFGAVKELRRDGDDFRSRATPYELPRLFSVQGSVFADLTGNGSVETATIRNQTLYIYSGTELLYESRQQVGGSLSQMKYYVHPGLKDGSLSTQGFEVPPLARDLDGDGIPELLAIATEGGLFRAPGVDPGVKKAWLAAFKYRDGMFVNGAFGEEIDTPVQGFYLAENMAYLVTTQPPSILGKGGDSHLISFPVK